MAVIRYRQMNDGGRYVGESHPKAKLSDQEVEQIRDMRERLGMSERSIARVMEAPRRTIRDILHYVNRCQTATRVIKYRSPI